MAEELSGLIGWARGLHIEGGFHGAILVEIENITSWPKAVRSWDDQGSPVMVWGVKPFENPALSRNCNYVRYPCVKARGLIPLMGRVGAVPYPLRFQSGVLLTERMDLGAAKIF